MGIEPLPLQCSGHALFAVKGDRAGTLANQFLVGKIQPNGIRIPLGTRYKRAELVITRLVDDPLYATLFEVGQSALKALRVRHGLDVVQSEVHRATGNGFRVVAGQVFGSMPVGQ